jgi:hypothetical protein
MDTSGAVPRRNGEPRSTSTLRVVCAVVALILLVAVAGLTRPSPDTTSAPEITRPRRGVEGASLVIALTARDEGFTLSQSSCIGRELSQSASESAQARWNDDFVQLRPASPALLRGIDATAPLCV